MVSAHHFRIIAVAALISLLAPNAIAQASAAELLRHDDIEVGDACDGRFAPWRLEPWDAHAKIQRELMAMETFLDDTQRFIFQRTRQA